MKYLQPLALKDKYFIPVRQEIQRIFNELIYIPLSAVLEKYTLAEIRNAVDDLSNAIKMGNIWYDNGLFRGHFNARTSKELRDIGASWNPDSKTFSLPEGDIPPLIKMAMAHADMHYDELKRALIQTLDDVNIESINALSNIPDKYMQSITWMNDDFDKTVRAVAVPSQLTEAQKGFLASEWSYNLDLYIKKWTDENILKLRQDIQENAFGGRRSSALIKYIQNNYQVSRHKAEFLARQETSLLMSKFHQSKYADIGVYEYRWSTSHDERVRPDHQELNDKVFNFQTPPVVDRKTGRRCNPGEDYGPCRCIAIPIIR